MPYQFDIDYRFPLCVWLPAMALAVLPAGVRADSPSPWEQTLAERGIDASAAGLVEYLRKLHPGEAEAARSRELIDRLGSRDFAEREAAAAELARMPVPPTEALRKAAAGDDAEVRWRARRLLELGGRSPVLYAVLKLLELRPAPEAVDALLMAVPLCEERHLRQAADAALASCVRPEDAPRLREALAHEESSIRAAAALALGAAAGEAAREDLASLLEGPAQAEVVAIAAARALADLGDRRCLPVLVRLLDADDLDVRIDAAATLRALTGQRFGYAAYERSENRTAAVDAWRAWVETSGTRATLSYPVKHDDLGASHLNGHILIAFGYKNHVTEFDAERKPVWKYQLQGAFSAEKLASGHVLIASYGPNRVVEVDPETGSPVWEYRPPSCLNARALPSGNVLIAAHTAKKVLEVSRDGEIVWEYASQHNCYDARRLENGNTLIAAQQTVIEIDPAGRTVWSHEARGSVYGVQPLPGGNVLLADNSRGAVEITRDHKTVWEFKTNGAFDAHRTPTGTTLISTNSSFCEVTRDGEVLWTMAGGGHGRARR
ncbi:MAG: PQQ-like beta-propeller repeat protein [Planctomycetes bacterium]|nr:PQQ-like beta-propeller repeat protein [Planctomycetota bacterium]